MKTYKILFGKDHGILSVTESTNIMPDGQSHYFDKAQDRNFPDFLLVKAEDANAARELGTAFLTNWEGSDSRNNSSEQ